MDLTKASPAAFTRAVLSGYTAARDGKPTTAVPYNPDSEDRAQQRLYQYWMKGWRWFTQGGKPTH